ncbi:MAG TPA: hypothetical protein ENN22_00095 [bacterium]|nr:hypothetical protein [bacterium]
MKGNNNKVKNNRLRLQLLRLIQEQQRIHLGLQIQDVYKLIYQSVFGMRHILENPPAALKFLSAELDAVEAVADEDLSEQISFSGELIRLNLRPYKAAGGGVDELFQVMLLSAQQTTGDINRFLKIWREFSLLVTEKKLNFAVDQLTDFNRQIQDTNYPPMHHSLAYRLANRPAYRVLLRRIAEERLPVFY